MSDAFANRVALVTGGSRGIGRATALRLAREGADVAISYASRTTEAEQVVAEIKALGRKAICVPCNVAKPDDVARLVAQTREQLGPIDLLAHCGAISNIMRPSRPVVRALARDDRRESERGVPGRVRGQGRDDRAGVRADRPGVVGGGAAAPEDADPLRLVQGGRDRPDPLLRRGVRSRTMSASTAWPPA